MRVRAVLLLSGVRCIPITARATQGLPAASPSAPVWPDSLGTVGSFASPAKRTTSREQVGAVAALGMAWQRGQG